MSFDRFRHLLLLTTVILISCSAPQQPVASSSSSTASSPASEVLLGRYYLVGVMETASGLELQKDGIFRWYLSVGALDILTGGTWSVENDLIALDFDPPPENARYDAIGRQLYRVENGDLYPVDGSPGKYMRSRNAGTGS